MVEQKTIALDAHLAALCRGEKSTATVDTRFAGDESDALDVNACRRRGRGRDDPQHLIDAAAIQRRHRCGQLRAIGVIAAEEGEAVGFTRYQRQATRIQCVASRDDVDLIVLTIVLRSGERKIQSGDAVHAQRRARVDRLFL